MEKLRPLVLSVLAIAAVAYVGGIVWAGVSSLRSATEPALPQIVTQALTAIGGLLATHFGAVFGISLLPGGAPQRLLRGFPWARRGRSAGASAAPLDWIQIAAAYLYLSSLVVAVVFWAIDGFSSQTAQVLITLSSTLIGVVVGIGAVVLNVKQP